MKGYQSTFKRYEMKYLLDEEKYRQIRQQLQDKMLTDCFGNTTVCNVYFDTPDRLLVRTSLEKPIYKEKLRLRSYGTPGDNDIVYVELKKKYKGIVYKRREKLILGEAEYYLYDHRPTAKLTQIIKEINWFISIHPDLEPSMYISYNRTAMYGIQDQELRVTFDSNLKWREEELWLGCGDWGKPILKQGQILMEVKFPEAMPLWLCHLLDELMIYPASFSKYGNAYQLSEIQKSKGQPKGEIIYA